MKKKICLLSAVIILLITIAGLTGCNNGVSGTYKATAGMDDSWGFDAVMVLKSNGTCTVAKSGDAVMDSDKYSGTYSVKDKVITFNLTRASEPDNEIECSGTILSKGNIKLKLFGRTLTYYKT